MGERADMSGEAASRSSLELPGRQEELLRAVVALGKPVVLVLIGGRPLVDRLGGRERARDPRGVAAGKRGRSRRGRRALRRRQPRRQAARHVPAQRAARQPLYYARNLTHQPEGSPQYRSRYWEGPTTPLYPFGYGLSYTTFAYSNLKLGAPQLKLGAAVTVSVDVTNSGPVAGDEVVQLYVHQKSGSDSRPVRELKGFKRVGLKPGETQTITLPARPRRAALLEHVRSAVGAGRDGLRRLGGRRTRQPQLHADLSVVP